VYELPFLTKEGGKILKQSVRWRMLLKSGRRYEKNKSKKLTKLLKLRKGKVLQ